MNRLFRSVSAAVVGLAAVALAATASAQDMGKSAKVGEKAPAWSAADLDGKTHALSDFKGKIVVLEWFNPDCPYCRNIYDNKRVHALLKEIKGMGDDVVYIAVNSTANKAEDVVAEDSRNFLKKHDVKIPVLMDYQGTIGHAYGARTTPHMFIIDGEGVLRYQGAFSDDPGCKNDGATNYVLAALKQIKAGETVAPDATKSWGCGVKYAKK